MRSLRKTLRRLSHFGRLRFDAGQLVTALQQVTSVLVHLRPDVCKHTDAGVTRKHTGNITGKHKS